MNFNQYNMNEGSVNNNPMPRFMKKLDEVFKLVIDELMIGQKCAYDYSTKLKEDMALRALDVWFKKYAAINQRLKGETEYRNLLRKEYQEKVEELNKQLYNFCFEQEGIVE